MKKILDGIHEPSDIKKLTTSELSSLSVELREEILDGVAKMGGHLSSNLGVVELTVALLFSSNLKEDQIVWDVGHQSYAYKLLTGRRDLFTSLRTLNGYSGFPKREESPYDAFNTGHSSTSVSAALGLLRAKHLKGEKGKVIAIIGDGALTGGMAYEALDDTGQFREDLLVILNDNQMSIDNNVGGLSKKLQNLRANGQYLKTKSRVEKILNHIPFFGKLISRIILFFKELLRLSISSNNTMFFEDLGFRYYGPIDGHDIPTMIHYLKTVQDINEPVLLHVCTKKGNGYSFAEEAPSKYHGVSPFDSKEGQEDSNKQTFTSYFGDALVALADKNKKVTAVCAAMMSSSGLSSFRKHHKLRFFDVGIAEEHAVTMAAGMAANGLIPVVAIYSTFIQRAYDQILHDICLQKLHVVLALDRAGIVGPDGETHQGIYDISILQAMPGMEIFAPRDFSELSIMLSYAVMEANGPVAIRYPRGSEEVIEGEHISISKRSQVLRSGEDITILSAGVMAKEAMEAADILKKEAGLSCEVIDLRCLKPLDEEAILKSVKKTKLIVSCEDGVIKGGIAQTIAKLLMDNQIYKRFIGIGVGDHPVQAGSREQLLEKEGMNAKSIAKACLSYFSK